MEYVSPVADVLPGRSFNLPPPEVLKTLPEAAGCGLSCEVAANGDVEGMRALFDAGVNVNIGSPYDKRTPLHLASAAGDLNMVRFLIEECGATLQRDRFGLLPIHDAVQNGHAEVRRYLQGRKLDDVLVFRTGPKDTKSLEQANENALKEETMSTVFELVIKEGVFSYTTVHAEVQHFFRDLRLHPVYFEHFTPLQVAKHIHCLIAAKRVARATDHVGQMRFVFKSTQSGFFLCAICTKTPTEAQLRTEDKLTEYLTECQATQECFSVVFMASEGPVLPGGKERLGIYTAERCQFEAVRFAEDETSLEILASSRFLKSKTKPAKEQYQILMEDVVASRRSVVRIVPGSVYPGPYPGGFVLLFATAETAGRHYFPEVNQAMRYSNLCPRRFYLETFANGVITYGLFFPSATQADMKRLESTIMYSTLLKSFPGRSEVIYKSVMQENIAHEVGLYLLAAVKFVYTFFPKESYAREYTDVHKVLEKDPGSQGKLEALYKMCMKELLSTQRIYDVVARHLDIAKWLFEDFRRIAMGLQPPKFSEEIAKAIDASCTDPQDCQILRMFITFNEAIILTNFFKTEIPGAFAFRLNPTVVLKNRPTSLYPEMPYCIYMICGRDFLGFHVRFRDVARGGIRVIRSRDQQAYENTVATLFEECYNLAITQQRKNKDIPEGGAKGVILPDSRWAHGGAGNALAGDSTQCHAFARFCFTRYLSALLDCMMPEQCGIYSGHMQGHKELLFFGPDENSADFMDHGAEIARVRGYPYWKAVTTGKSVRLGGVPHDTYGMTTASVHTYVLELLKKLGLDERAITKFQTGGPDGDLGSNEILVSKDKTIAIVDGSGVAYEPEGLNRVELVRLAKSRVPIAEFSRSYLSEQGFLVKVEDTDVRLPDGSQWRTGAELRDNFHLTDYAKADLFVPCGGRPNSVNSGNMKRLFGKGGSPKFRMVVDGANLFFSMDARRALELAGVHVFMDASTNKGGVNSSSLEVLAALALPPPDHTSLMTYDPDQSGTPPEFYEDYVKQIRETIVRNARAEFNAIWKCNQENGMSKVEATHMLSSHINQMQDNIKEHMVIMSKEERDQLVRNVMIRAVPQILVQRMGLDKILETVPSNYVDAVVGAWVASRYVYRYGINANEVSFFFFMRSLFSQPLDEDPVPEARKRRAPSGDEAGAVKTRPRAVPSGSP